MLTVLFFAQLRERLQCDKLQLDTAPGTVAELRAKLSEKSLLWSELITSEKAIAAVNQTISHNETVLQDGDEVAFFPPVTGG